MAETDKALEKLGANIRHTNNKTFVKFVTALLYVSASGLLILDLAAYSILFDNISRVLLVLVFVVPLIINLATTCIVTFYMILLMQRFKKINEVLQDIVSNIKHKKKIIESNEE